MVSDTIHANLLELVIAVSKVIDLLSPDINDHHARVAYGAYAIAKEMRLEGGAVTDLLLAALLHDIGIISIEAHAEVIKYDSADVSAHAYKGWSLLKGFCHL
ncbi:MAG: HD domain-containing protein, partial [Chromatiales bacterium]|nr:HD domain-containing protein [Chromatiales bacterium]